MKEKRRSNRKKSVLIGICAGVFLAVGLTAAYFLTPDREYYMGQRRAAPEKKPVPTGTFIQPWYCADWTENDFAAHFECLRALGTDKLIIQWTADTPEGKIRTVYYDTELPESCFAENAVRYPAMLENCLSAAQKTGVQVFIGLNLADEWWDFAVKDAAWREKQSALSAAMAKEIHTLYGEKYPDAFHGWYWAWELTNGFQGAEAAAELLNSDLAALDALEPALPLLFSPFNSKNSGYKSAEREWTEFFAQVRFRPGDIFCLQDAIGAEWIGFDDLDFYYAAAKRAVQTKPELVFWANCENFTKDYRPADVGRFRRQLDTAALYADEIVSFSLSHYYLNPEFGAEPQKSYRALCGA